MRHCLFVRGYFSPEAKGIIELQMKRRQGLNDPQINKSIAFLAYQHFVREIRKFVERNLTPGEISNIKCEVGWTMNRGYGPNEEYNTKSVFTLLDIAVFYELPEIGKKLLFFVIRSFHISSFF